ncbi:hypothetical protein [Kordiimonas gwangyangensis]|uniref:hypothetical protein n=1 Tax=Kordiimonas gwangyangensis TaxID=288022 RepID=UPI000377DED1|nr:hypothetical protein [Kordiimonas gwangyangensis]
MAEIYDGITGEELAAALAGKSDAGHTHGQYQSQAQADGRYYQKGEVDTALDGLTSELNGISSTLGNINAELDAVGGALASKAEANHGHTLASLTDVGEEAPADGESLVWHAGVGEWRPALLAGGGGSGGVTDHGALTGLGDDDHPQYLNATRGDARYYVRAYIDTNFYTKAAIDTALAGKASASHGHTLASLTDVGEEAPEDGESLVWHAGVGEWRPATISSGGVTDHGALSGLGDDDHPQYLNSTRGDARYYTKGQVDAALATKAPAISRVRVTANHTAQPEQIIAADSDVGPITITAPANPADGTFFFVGDAGGNAALNNITVNFGGEQFDGAVQTFVINVNTFSTGFLYNGSEWELFG